MVELSFIALPTWAIRDLWRWGLIAMGVVVMAHGLFGRNVKMRDSGSWQGLWHGKIVTKPWQVLLMRTLFTLIGASMVVCGLSPNFPQ
jgi:hypothetical protein